MKIAIFLVGRIGDMILSTPMYSAIKKKYPDSEITVIAGKNNFNILNNNPYLDKVWIFDKNPLKLIPLLLKAISARFDYWLDPKDHFSSESAIMAYLCRAKNTVGFNRPKRHNFDFEIPTYEDNYRLHYSQRCYNALIPIGINVPKLIPSPELYEPENYDAQEVSQYLSKDKKNILVNLSASSDTRIYPADKWIEVLQAIDANKYNVVLSFVEEHKYIADSIKSKISSVKFNSSVSIWNLISIIKRVDYVISPDTAAVHIAAAFNIPIIALYNDKKENYIRFKPSSDISIVIVPEDSKYISSIIPSQIIQAIEKIMV